MQSLSNSTLFWSSSSTDTIDVFCFDNHSLDSRYSVLKLVRVFGRIGASLKYFKRTTCFFFLWLTKWGVHNRITFWILDLLPTTPILGEGVKLQPHQKCVLPQRHVPNGVRNFWVVQKFEGGVIWATLYIVHTHTGIGKMWERLYKFDKISYWTRGIQYPTGVGFPKPSD